MNNLSIKNGLSLGGRLMTSLKEKIGYKTLLFTLFIGLLWCKINYVQTTVFDLDITSSFQKTILYLNPLSSILLILAIGVLFRYWGIFVSYLITTVILFANVLYYRESGDFITVPLLFQTSNFGDLGSSVISMVKWPDIFLFIDVIAMFILLKLLKKDNRIQWKKRFSVIFAIPAIAVFFVNLTLAEIERPDLLTRTFDRVYLVKNLGLLNYHIYDAVLQIKTNTQRAMADSTELHPVKEYIKSSNKTTNTDITGIAEGKNLIVVPLESLQTFVIDNELNGEVITPFLNEFKKNSIYFDNFYHQVAQGRSSDSEFLLENSLYPTDRGAVFFTHGQNKYYSMAQVLKENGYYTSVLHSNNGSFWNRNVVYDTFGIDRFYTVEDFEVTEENSVGWGLKDKPFFTQSIEYLKEMPQPFYSRLITLTNHHPFTLNEEDISISAGTFRSQTLNRYFQTVRYMDEAFEQFIQQLKDEGLYENSIIVAFGDHFGISENHTGSMEQYLGIDIGDFENFELQKVPLFIHIPGYTDNEVNHTVSGQVDLRPTILNLLGVEDPNPVVFGEDLLSKDRQEFVVFRDGSYATDTIVSKNGVCYNKNTGLKVESDECNQASERAKLDLLYSNQVIYGDLLRFAELTEANRGPTK